MTGHELVSRNAVTVLTPTLGQHVFFLRLQHREPPDLIKVPAETRFGRDDW
jgi:hypothetical protein